MDTLEKALCSAEGLGTLEHNKIKAAASKKKTAAKQSRSEVSHLQLSSGQQEEASSSEITEATPPRRPLSAHEGQSTASPSNGSEIQRRHSYNMDSRDSSNTVFEPLPVTSTVEIPVSTTGAEGGVVLEEVEPFPRLGANQPVDNTLPSAQLPLPTPTAQPNLSTSTPSLSLPSPDTNSSPAKTSSSSPNDSKPKKSKPKGPAGFQSAEDLMHRLFLGISGVADQLQTNHAKDLRVILKNVFTVCQSESESSDVIQCLSVVSQKKYSSVDELEPCTPEPQSPLITASQSKHMISVSRMYL